jgi:two-component system response regulator MprA
MLSPHRRPGPPLTRVVIVEDDAQMRSALGLLVRGFGAEVLAEIGDGEAALDVLATRRTDLILTDCQMPRLDGIALVRRLRARGDHTPVIMISGRHEQQVRDAAFAAGVSQYLFKPLSAAALRQAIGQTLTGRAA